MTDDERIKKNIEKEENPERLNNIRDNALRLERPDIANLVLQRLCELEGKKYNDPLESRFYEVLVAYEECLTRKNGRKTRATRTRQKIENKGFKQCLIDWAMESKLSDGFETLMKEGLYELTGEYLVCEFADQFAPEAVDKARKRLREWDITV